ATLADIATLHLPSAADRVGETERQEPAVRLLRGERRRQTRQAYQHCEHGPTHVRSPHRRRFQRPDRAALHRPPPPCTVGGGGDREVTLRAGRPPPLVPVVLRGRRSRSAHP